MAAPSGFGLSLTKPQGYHGPRGAKKKLHRSKRITKRTNETPMEYLKIMENIYKDLHNHLRLPSIHDEESAVEVATYRKRMKELVEKEHLRPNSKMSIMTESLLSTVTRAANAQALIALRAARWISYQGDSLNLEYTSLAADHTMALLFSCLGPSPHQIASNLVVQWQRYYEVAHTFGWRYLSVLAFSDTFRQYVLEATEQKWVEWLNYADDARLSIEVFGAFHCPEWYIILRRALGGTDMKRFMADEETILEYDGHHHLWGFTVEGDKVIKAERIVSYEVIEKAILRTGFNYGIGRDPRNIKLGKDAKFCVVCGQKMCDCPTHVWVPCLVEIIRAGAKGFGVRALQTIEAEQVIGEYVGELVKAGNSLYPQDNYMLRGKAGNDCLAKEKDYYITSKKKGNWTRFVNHGCREAANCGIDHHDLRGKSYAVYVARKKIAMYEELTVDYGPSYWGGSAFPCLCSAKTHYTDGIKFK